MSKPLVSIVLPIHKAERYLAAAVQSLLAQTWEHFELLAILDGPDDACAAILADHADARLRVIERPRSGLVAVLNHGLDVATGNYVARMDADDIAEPDRIERQVRAMERDPSLGILGTAVQRIDEAGRELTVERLPEDDLELRWTLLWGPCFFHPTVMLRRSVLERHGLRYDPQARHMEDFELWVRLMRYCRGANLREPLLRYRVHGCSVTGLHAQEGDQRAQDLTRGQLALLLPHRDFDAAGVRAMRALFHGPIHPDWHRGFDVAAASTQLQQVLAAFAAAHGGEPSLAKVRRDALALLARRCLRGGRLRGVAAAAGILLRHPAALLPLTRAAIKRLRGRATDSQLH